MIAPSSRTSRSAIRALGAALLLAASPSAFAGNLVYQPVNPAFGGSPLNGGWLQSEAQAQNEHQRKQQRLEQLRNAIEQERSGTSRDLTPGQLFARQLQSQLYGSLANQITQAIFGENAQQSGTFRFEGTTINFRRVGPNVELTINDGTTTTVVTVPAGI